MMAKKGGMGAGYPGSGGGGGGGQQQQQQQQQMQGRSGMGANYPGAGGGGGGGQQQQQMQMQRKGAMGAGYPGAGGGGGPGGPGGPGMPGGAASAAKKPPSYKTPASAVKAFIDAATDKDAELLAEATALRAPTTAKHYSQKKFLAIRESSLDADEMDKIAAEFKGYRVTQVFPGDGTKIGKVQVIRQGNQRIDQRVIVVRREAAGWKVVDVEQAFSSKVPGMRANRGNSSGGGGGGGGGMGVGGYPGGRPAPSAGPAPAGGGGGGGGTKATDQ